MKEAPCTTDTYRHCRDARWWCSLNNWTVIAKPLPRFTIPFTSAKV